MRIYGRCPTKSDPSFGVTLRENTDIPGDGIWLNFREADNLRRSLERELRRISLRSIRHKKKGGKAMTKRTRGKSDEVYPWCYGCNASHDPRKCYDKGAAGRANPIESMPKVGGRLPMPLRWDDLCECGDTRLHHSGRHGMGRAVNGCPSFKEAK